MFDYHLKQHDSQTSAPLQTTDALFDYHLKQHDSQTSNGENATTRAVLFQMVSSYCSQFTPFFCRIQGAIRRDPGPIDKAPHPAEEPPRRVPAAGVSTSDILPCGIPVS